jgi:hypothetical protein
MFISAINALLSLNFHIGRIFFFLQGHALLKPIAQLLAQLLLLFILAQYHCDFIDIYKCTGENHS